MSLRAVAVIATSVVSLGGLAGLSVPAASATTAAPATAATAESALRAAAGSGVTIDRRADGVAKFVGTAAGHPARRPSGLVAGAAPETVARAHLARYGVLLGVRDQAHELTTERVAAGPARQSIVRFRQTLAGLPVFGAELSVALNASGDLLSINGETAPAVASTSFATSAASAAQIAVGSAARANHVPAARLRASTPQQLLYDPALVSRSAATAARPVWQVEVRSTDGSAIRQLVLVDGASGAVALSFNQVAQVKERHVCDKGNVVDVNNGCGSTYIRSEGEPPSSIADVNNAYDYSGATYDFYNTQFGRDSVDNAGLPLISATRYCPDSADCPYANAFWDGTQMTYGEGYASADDVVAHELTHGVTQYTSNLLYYYQSGAINESMSDIFGEFVDQTDGLGTDTAAVKWQLGEDLPGGPIRDMKNPTLFGQPDSTSSPNWNSDWYDAGGVHQNSGVGNKAAYLMTDGGALNGTTVTGIGVTKAAAVYYEAENLLTTGADYRDLYNVLQQSCTNLVGTKGITTGDCAQVTNAVTAVRMIAYPTNDPRLPAAPPTCAASPIFSDNFNGTLANWTLAGPWTTDGSYQPSTSAGTALFVPDVNPTADYKITTTQSFVVPSDRSTYFRFDHAESFDWIGPNNQQVPVAYYDGGFVEVSTDNGSTWSQLPIAANGYNATLEPPLSRSAFSGDSTDWYSSQATLSAYAGRSVKLRFRMVTDGVSAASTAYGWWIDNVNLYSCPNHQVADFTGNGAANLGIWRPSSHTFYVKNVAATSIGTSSDVPVPGDYNGDGRSEPATWRPSTGVWTIAGQAAVQFGQAGDVPVPADYNGDGRTDIAVRRGGTWYIRNIASLAFGLSTDRPVVADYNGDGRADIAVWRPSNGGWYINGSSPVAFGASTDRPMAADYNGDGRAEVAVWRPSNGTWYVLGMSPVAYGASTDRPVSADYTGDGRADIAVWRPSNGGWYIRGASSAVAWGGASGDLPLR